MPNLWGLMFPRASMDAAQRANILIGYPMAFSIPDWDLVSRSSDDSYSPVSRSSDSDWSTINRSI